MNRHTGGIVLHCGFTSVITPAEVEYQIACVCVHSNCSVLFTYTVTSFVGRHLKTIRECVCVCVCIPIAPSLEGT